MTMDTNPSVVLYGPGSAAIENKPIPRITNPNDVIVRISFVGVCGSDVHFWTHGGIGDKLVQNSGPLVLGHEAAGIVHTVGDSVTDLKVGDRVALEPGKPCRSCRRCKEGQYNLCPTMEFSACPPATPGTLSKFFKIPEDFCYRLPPNISLQEGVLAEPLAVAAHAVRMIDVRPGQSVIIFGAGTVGLLCAALARRYGAKQVVSVDIIERKLDFAKKFANTTVFKPDLQATASTNAARLIDEAGLGLGADTVIEASGAESSINTAIYALRPGGQMVQTGLGKPSIHFPIVEFGEKEIHMHGAFRYKAGDFDVAMDILSEGTIPIKELISEIVDFERATDAWEATKNGRGIKNMIAGVQD